MLEEGDIARCLYDFYSIKIESTYVIIETIGHNNEKIVIINDLGLRDTHWSEHFEKDSISTMDKTIDGILN